MPAGAGGAAADESTELYIAAACAKEGPLGKPSASLAEDAPAAATARARASAAAAAFTVAAERAEAEAEACAPVSGPLSRKSSLERWRDEVPATSGEVPSETPLDDDIEAPSEPLR